MNYEKMTSIPSKMAQKIRLNGCHCFRGQAHTVIIYIKDDDDIKQLQNIIHQLPHGDQTNFFFFDDNCIIVPIHVMTTYNIPLPESPFDADVKIVINGTWMINKTRHVHCWVDNINITNIDYSSYL